MQLISLCAREERKKSSLSLPRRNHSSGSEYDEEATTGNLDSQTNPWVFEL